MLGLQLRDEFKGRRLKGTAIELTNKNNTGATQIPAADFLRITYPSTDLLKTLEAAGPGQGRPVTLKGGRGQGKSHLMAALYHADLAPLAAGCAAPGGDASLQRFLAAAAAWPVAAADLPGGALHNVNTPADARAVEARWRGDP